MGEGRPAAGFELASSLLPSPHSPGAIISGVASTSSTVSLHVSCKMRKQLKTTELIDRRAAVARGQRVKEKWRTPPA